MLVSFKQGKFIFKEVSYAVSAWAKFKRENLRN
jgi:hypothetical protein